MQNPILQISYSYKNQTTYPLSVPLSDIDDEITIPIRSTSFRVTKTKEKKHVTFIIDDFGKNAHTLSHSHPVMFQPDSNHKYRFQITNDFVTSDTKRFSKFIKTSIGIHLMVALIFSIFQLVTPEKDISTAVTIDSERIKKIMEKIKKNKELKKKIAKVVATPAPKKVEKKVAKVKPKPKLKPKPRKIAKVKPKRKKKKVVKRRSNVSTGRKVAKPTRKRTGPAKRLVARKGPKRIGGSRLSKKYTPSRGGGRKVKSSLARGKPGGGKARHIANAKSRLSNSLGFLSAGKSKFSVPGPTIGKAGKKYSPGGGRGKGRGGGGKGKKNYLNKLVAYSGRSGGGRGPIQTTGARSIASGKVISDGDIMGSDHGKSYNSVQGKVNMNRLYDYKAEGNIGGALGDERSMSMSGKGKLAKSAIERILAKHIHKLQYCYEKALLFNPRLTGNLWVKWKIQPSGRVSSARVTKSELKNKKLHTCIMAQIRKIRFPRPKGGYVEVQYPFNFTSSSL